MGATAACAMRTGEGTMQVKEAMIILKGGAWFSSVKAAVVAAKRGMEAVH